MPPQAPPQPYYQQPPPQQYYQQPPPPAYYPPQPPPPAADSDTPWAAVGLGLTGGLIAIIGAILPWVTFQTCSQTSILRICLPFGLPGSWGGVGSYNGLLPILGPLALVMAIAGLVLLFLNKPVMGIASAGLGAGAMLMGILHILIAGPLLDQMGVDLSVGQVGVSVTANIGVGAYVAIVGGLLLMIAGLVDWKMLKDKEAKKAAAGDAAPAASAPPTPPTPPSP